MDELEDNENFSNIAKFVCTECNLNCTSKKLLKQHFKAHHGVKRYPCTKCSLILPKKSLLKEHMASHLVPEPIHKTEVKLNNKTKPDLKCPHCNFSTRRKAILKRHTKLCLTAPRLKCPDCDLVALTKRELYKHIQSAHFKEDYKTCSECGYVALTLSILEKHKRVHFSSQVFDCSLCMFATKYEASLERHIKLVHLNERIHQCQICDYKSKEKGDLNKHMRVHGFSFFCPFCSKIFTTLPTFQKHSCMETYLNCQQVYDCFPDYLGSDFSSSSKNFEKYTCAECEREFDNKPILNRHMMKRHPRKYCYLCWSCGFCFATFPKLKAHPCKEKKDDLINSSEKNDIEKKKKFKVPSDKISQVLYQCQYCDYQTPAVKSLTCHTKNVHHENKDLFGCSECSFQAERKYDLRKHESLVHNKHIHLCPKCGIKFNKLRKLRQHTCEGIAKDENTNEGYSSEDDAKEEMKTHRFKCDLCSYTSFYKSMIIRHFNCVHENLRQFPCSQCEYQAKEKGDLKKHFLWVHATVRGPFICSNCKESFTIKSHFRSHRCDGKKASMKRKVSKYRSINPGNSRQYLCHKCPYVTSYHKSLNRHLSCVHSNVRNFSCALCDHKSKCKGDLKKHLASVHAIDSPYICQGCLTSFKLHQELKTHECEKPWGKREYVCILDHPSSLKKDEAKYVSLNSSKSLESNIELPNLDEFNLSEMEQSEEAITIESLNEALQSTGGSCPTELDKAVIKITCIPFSDLPSSGNESTKLFSKDEFYFKSPEKHDLTLPFTQMNSDDVEIKEEIESLDSNHSNEDSFSFFEPNQIFIKSEPVDERSDSNDFVGFEPDDLFDYDSKFALTFSPPSPIIDADNDAPNEILGLHYESNDMQPFSVVQSLNTSSVSSSNSDTQYAIAMSKSDSVVMHELTADHSYLKDHLDVSAFDIDVSSTNCESLDNVTNSKDSIALQCNDSSICSETNEKSPTKTKELNKKRSINSSNSEIEGLGCLGCKFFCKTLEELLTHLQSHQAQSSKCPTTQSKL